MAEKLFDHYKQLSVKKGGLDTIDAVQAPAFEQLATDLGIDVEDPVLLVLAWKCSAETPFQISRNEWKNGMAKLGVKDASTLKSKVPQLRKDVAAKPAFRDFYFWVFGFVKEGDQKVLANDAAVAYWRLLLSKPPMNWELLDEWCEFVENVHKKAIVKDVWKQLYDFMTLPNLAAYDPNGAWPTMIDDFVEYLKEKGKTQ